MRIKIDKTRIIEVEAIDISIASDNKTIDGFLCLFGGAWDKEYKVVDEHSDYWSEQCLGKFDFGEYKEDWHIIAQDKANAITDELLKTGYLDLTKYDNFSFW